MKLSCTSWSFPYCTLEEIAGIVRVLGIDAVDLGFFYRSALDKAGILSDPGGAAQGLGLQGLDVSSLYYLFGDSAADRNLADPASLEINLADFHQVVAFCRAADIPSVMLLPGVVNPGQSRRDALAQSANALEELLPIAQAAGVVLTVEPHVHAYLESPSLVLELLDRVPGLKLTLDYAHFVCLGYRQDEIDGLARHAAHVHLRQARSGVLQTKLEEGTINLPAMLGTLREAGYDGDLAIEYVHQEYMNTFFDDVLSETVKMRDLVRRHS